jgi:hypothetical protein
METVNIILILLLVLFIITIIGHIMVVNSKPQETTSTVVIRNPNYPYHPQPPPPHPQPQPQPHIIGGCAGTQYGCCPNGVTAKANYAGTNCY